MLALVSSGFFIIAMVFALVAGQIKEGSLTRNGDVGIKTKQTRASDEAWLAGHKAVLPLIKNTGWVMLAFGIAVLVIALTVPYDWVTLTLAGAGYGILMVLAWLMTRTANRAAQAV